MVLFLFLGGGGIKKYEKEVQQAFLDNEKEVLKRLEKTYSESLEDIEKKAKKLQEQIEELDKLAKLPMSDEEKEVLLSRKRAKVYQKQYQEALKKQVAEILDKMHTEEFKTVSEYLDKCYNEGFAGSLYSLQQQGLPLAFPIDQEAMVRAVQLDSKISKGLYTRLGEDISRLKKMIASDVSRGISTGMTFKQIAGQLKAKTNIGYNNAVRIARTEGHRIQCQSAMDACYKAKDIGADVVKQWDSTLDSRTRESHAMVDGEIKELDEKFSNGLMFPGDPSGGAAEVINCRCALLQRARRALDEDELEELKKRAEYFGLDKTKNFEEYKQKYLKASKDLTNNVKDDIISGAVSGARNPFGEKAKEHAERYYASVRKMKTDVSTISRNLGIPEEDIKAVKNFIFLEKHDLGGAELEYFAPDYMMAESWQRLIAGKQEPHDITLIKHEILERKLMRSGLSQEESHIKASKEYNYSKEAGEYYAKIKKYKKD